MGRLDSRHGGVEAYKQFQLGNLSIRKLEELTGIKTDLKETAGQPVDWILQTQDTVQWRATVKTV
jgi:hypothetical protein